MNRRIGRSATAIGVLIALGTVVAACTDETNGNPQPPGQTLPSGDNSAVPRVTTPLDAEPFLRRPCELLDDKTLSALGGKAGEPDVNSDMAKKLTGPNCTWDDASGWFDVAIQTVHRDKAAENLKGLDGVYASRDNFPLRFEPTEIPGHPGNPAVITQGEGDDTEGTCSVRVGIADDLTFVAGATNDEDANAACPTAVKVATGVLDTLKKGA